MVSAELHAAHQTITFALQEKRWWRPDEELSTEAWKQYKHLLAPHLSYDAWTDLWPAALNLTNANVLAAAPRPSDKPDEIFLKETETALTRLLDSFERGRTALIPYLAPEYSTKRWKRIAGRVSRRRLQSR